MKYNIEDEYESAHEHPCTALQDTKFLDQKVEAHSQSPRANRHIHPSPFRNQSIHTPSPTVNSNSPIEARRDVVHHADPSIANDAEKQQPPASQVARVGEEGTEHTLVCPE